MCFNEFKALFHFIPLGFEIYILIFLIALFYPFRICKFLIFRFIFLLS
ncbi:hypothetical protein CAMGR0001_2447 [Campylobacter gracilis RM3268]|uniref:Uncharacterized protein n=1 Tax=Campylobacter gracilis RM3268 TaxID=553220 RepID=C8PE96_9BACT|nr:hypothetical protein CAMGR0001_2447 [Campylobacter gracilis RM3268]